MVYGRIFGFVVGGLLIFLGFAPCGAKAGTAGPDEESTISLPEPYVSQARQLLRAGQTAAAERLVRESFDKSADELILCLSGEIAFRRANFPEASRAFTAALERNPESARAHWGLGRIDQIHFRHTAARDHFARAYALDHRDPDIILSYAGFVDDPAARATLLRNVTALTWKSDPERAERAVAQLRVLERLRGQAAFRLATPYTDYRIALGAFRPSGVRQEGLLLPVSINGSKPLRLVLDSGARGLVIDARAAKGLNLEVLAPSSLGGFGDHSDSGSRLSLARNVSIGGMAFEDCLVEVSDHSLTAGADGVAGIDLFQNFRIRLNPGARVLELTPLEEGPADSPSAIPALGIRNLLLVRTRLDTGREGLFLLDTGAAFTSVTRELAPVSTAQGQPVALQGAQGPLSGALRVPPLELSVGGRAMVDVAPVALDMRRISQAEGIEISGVLGYSLLARSTLTIDLRKGTVDFGERR
jgi:tetratricopeptide (TPR) repeat protein